jgi:hypothetical protein
VISHQQLQQGVNVSCTTWLGRSIRVSTGACVSCIMQRVSRLCFAARLAAVCQLQRCLAYGWRLRPQLWLVVQQPWACLTVNRHLACSWKKTAPGCMDVLAICEIVLGSMKGWCPCVKLVCCSTEHKATMYKQQPRITGHQCVCPAMHSSHCTHGGCLGIIPDDLVQQGRGNMRVVVSCGSHYTCHRP